MTALAAAAEPSRGWGGPVAILVAFAVMYLIHRIVQYREGHSPPPPGHARIGAKPQVSEVPGTNDTDRGTNWWGRIVTDETGQRVRQVWKTGSSELPADDEDWIGDAGDVEAEDLDGWVRANLGAMGYAELVRAGVKRWRVSTRTMKRRIADAKYDAG
jgi:hypothetical protein